MKEWDIWILYDSVHILYLVVKPITVNSYGFLMMGVASDLVMTMT